METRHRSPYVAFGRQRARRYPGIGGANRTITAKTWCSGLHQRSRSRSAARAAWWGKLYWQRRRIRSASGCCDRGNAILRLSIGICSSEIGSSETRLAISRFYRGEYLPRENIKPSFNPEQGGVGCAFRLARIANTDKTPVWRIDAAGPACVHWASYWRVR